MLLLGSGAEVKIKMEPVPCYLREEQEKPKDLIAYNPENLLLQK